MVINITIITTIIATMCHTIIISDIYSDIMDMMVSLEHLVELTSKKLASATAVCIFRWRRLPIRLAWPCDFVETGLSFRCCLVLDVGYYTPPE